MKIRKSLLTGAVAGMLSLGAPLAFGHAMLTDSSPPAGARITEAPRELTLTFSAPLHLTYVALIPVSGEPIRLAPPTRQASAAHALPLPALAPNAYTVEWRAMSGDGHVMKGAWQFQVAGDA